MRRGRSPDDLTPREREVLTLLRRGLTNDEIAQRLGISLDGAKYHVSQILSKLDVTTREEAAAVVLGERWRWWARWPLWARIAGAATVAPALAGLAVLAWAAIRDEESTEQITREPQSASPTVTQSPSGLPSGPTIIDPTLASGLDGWPIVLSAQQGNDFEVYVLDGANLRNLSRNPSQPDFLPALSPDGTRIAYFVHRSEVLPGTEADNKPQFVDKREVYVQNLDGTDRRKLAEAIPSHDNVPPVWSPNGTRIAFESEPEEGNGEIFIINADGSNLVNLTNHPASDYGPTWSPDSTRIAFSSDRDGAEGIYIAEIGGPEIVRLTTGIAFTPAWSPHGSLIAFSRREGSNGEIYVINSDGTGERNLTNNPANDFPGAPVGHHPPIWSPDGSRIAFLSDRDGHVEIYVMNVLDGAPTRLTRNQAEVETLPFWSPDGEHIAFNSWGIGTIHVARADGSENPRPIINLQPAASDPLTTEPRSSPTP